MGKTFVTINKILEEIKHDPSKGRSVHFVLTMNTLLNNKQFANRLSDIKEEHGQNSVAIFTSTYNGDLTHIDSLCKLIRFSKDSDKMPKIIVACSNHRRFIDCFNYMEFINKTETSVKRSFIYFDELHKYIKSKNINIRGNIEKMDNYDIVHGIMAMTATPDVLWKKSNEDVDDYWSKIAIINIDKHNENNYFGWKDMEFYHSKFVLEEDSNEENLYYNELYNIKYAEAIIHKNPEILIEGSRSFIPATRKRKTHNLIRKIVMKANPECVVVTLNGVEKNICYFDKEGKCEKIDIVFKSGELGDIIALHLHENMIFNRPLVVTGYLCVGMGQTLVSKDLGVFTTAIFGYSKITNDNLYQLFGRITGRIKNWTDNTIKIKVFCSKINSTICNKMEECAKNIVAKHNGVQLGNDKYREPINDDKDIIKNFAGVNILED
tara:strand:- start:2362 stop:3669 length:1308 start_codon:yes stop_codon:yes gene_type:complete